MAVNNVVTTQAQEVYQTTYQKSEPKKADEKKEEAVSNAGVVYEKSEAEGDKKATYSINQMSAQDRDAVVKQLRADAENRQKSLMDLVRNMMTGQAKTATIASAEQSDDSIWKFIASGEYEVDEETQRQAQEDISEDGYWGVKQTSQRLFDFASALAGDDVDTMKKMQNYMMKGYEEAQKAWGRDMPEITQKTMDAAEKLFEDYYKSKEVVQ